jgi:acyl carrier protein
MQKEDISEVVRGVVSELCNVPSSQIEGTADFFELGFHSLMIIQLVARLQDRFDMDFAVSDFFTFPCVNGIAAMIESKQAKFI